MTQIFPLYYDPSTGQYLKAKPGDVIGVPVLGILADQFATLYLNADANTCFALIDQTASPVNSTNDYTSIIRPKPYVDGVVLESRTVGQSVKVVTRHGEKAYTPISLPVGTILYLGRDAKLTYTEPTLAAGDLWLVEVGRYVNSNEFIFDPQPPVNLSGSGGSGGTNLPDPIGQDHKYVGSNGTDYVLKSIRESEILPNFEIINLSITPSLVELGQTVNLPTLNSSYTENPIGLRLKDSDNPTYIAVTPPTSTSFQSSYNFIKNILTSVDFTLEATNIEPTIVTKVCSLEWNPRIYWGTGSYTSNPSAFILSLGYSGLSSSRNKVFTVTPGSTEKIYFAYPTSFGLPTFFVGGFEGGFKLISDTISVTNAFGVTLQYSLYESDNSNLGTTTVTVT